MPSPKKQDFETDLENLPSDRGDRKRIIEYPLNQRDEVRRKYLMRGPCQPCGHEFPKTLFQGLTSIGPLDYINPQSFPPDFLPHQLSP